MFAHNFVPTTKLPMPPYLSVDILLAITGNDGAGNEVALLVQGGRPEIHIISTIWYILKKYDTSYKRVVNLENHINRKNAVAQNILVF